MAVAWDVFEVWLREAVEDIDFAVGASVDDFLATPEMQAERDRIATALGAGP